MKPQTSHVVTIEKTIEIRESRESVTEATSDIDLRVGQLAIRHEFLNLSELKHCMKVWEKLLKKGRRVDDFGEILVQERYLTPENLEYIHMIATAEPVENKVTLSDIEAEFKNQVAEIKKGAKFGPYLIEDELGRGGMGVVLKAVDTDNNVEIALKILIGQDKATVRDIERFKKEATVMMPLIHGGIVKILGVGRIKGLDYIAMEYIRGKSLKEIVKELQENKKKPYINQIRALEIIRSAAEAVAFIHGHGIIHRDIKPENIMVRDSNGEAVLMDFGLAGWDKIEILAGRGSIGTPMYQPPEQAEVGGPFGKISEASDVYGLGATLYYLITNSHPFTGRSVKEVREKIKKEPPITPSARRKDLSEAAESLILRCMKKPQKDRFKTPKDFIDAIDKVINFLDPEYKKRKKSGSGRSTKQINNRRATVKTPAVAPRDKKRRRQPKSPRGTRTAPAHSKRQPRQREWHENPAVLIAGAVVFLIILAAIGAVLVQ